MRLYFVPFACSLAARIAMEEGGLTADFVEVGPGKEELPDGRSFRQVSPLGYVPALELDDGTVLTEGPAILQFLADQAPAGVLAPAAGTLDRTRLQQWLNFVGTELHKLVFTPLLASQAPEGAREFAGAKLGPRFDHLSAHLDGREHLLDRFSVADAYLLAVLNWCEASRIDLAAWPVLAAYRARLRQRPSIAAAMRAERPLLTAA